MTLVAPPNRHVFKGLKPHTQEKECSWVMFPNKREYLLPLVSRQQKYIPHFKDGKVEMEVKCPDENLSPVIEEFLKLLINNEEKNKIKLSMAQYASFFNLLKCLIEANYTLSDEEMETLFTMNIPQLYQMFNKIILLVMEI